MMNGDGPALVILSAGREAPGAEGSRTLLEILRLRACGAALRMTAAAPHDLLTSLRMTAAAHHDLRRCAQDDTTK